MPDWLVWLAVFWLLFGCGTGCRRAWSRRRLKAGRGSIKRGALRPGARRGSETAASLARGAPSSSPPGKDAGPDAEEPETRLAALQRRFVDGAITLEQYEAELDMLDRKELG